MSRTVSGAPVDICDPHVRFSPGEHVQLELAVVAPRPVTMGSRGCATSSRKIRDRPRAHQVESTIGAGLHVHQRSAIAPHAPHVDAGLAPYDATREVTNRDLAQLGRRLDDRTRSAPPSTMNRGSASPSDRATPVMLAGGRRPVPNRRPVLNRPGGARCPPCERRSPRHARPLRRSPPAPSHRRRQSSAPPRARRGRPARRWSRRSARQCAAAPTELQREHHPQGARIIV